jgi:murein DD-endopeptidase MepM/ murein hydrolase activator NlpD
MNVILIPRRDGRARQFNLTRPLTLGLLVTVFAGLAETTRFAQLLTQQKQQIADLRQQLQLRVDAMAMRIGEVNAHVIRLDALGKRLTEMADIDSREFNFDRDPPSGGPSDGDGVSAQIPDLSAQLAQLEQRADLRESQLAALENVILARELKQEIHPEGRPVATGYISSYFGERADPFDGREAFHKGVDFAGTQGSDVVAVAAGVVTWAGPRSGYGKLIEINHGDGYTTRYAHNERTLVAVGQTVKRGEPIALMGSTGHSTGPHVHFEVLKNGRQVDPLSFIGR